MFWKGKCYGAASLGPKGDIVIPAAARKEFGFDRGDKLLVFGHPEHGIVVLIEADRVNEMVSTTFQELSDLSERLGLSDQETDEDE